jgi:hypothetical protein
MVIPSDQQRETSGIRRPGVSSPPAEREILSMAELTAYQYVKLGSNLEYLRGISSVSIMQTGSLAAFPNLLENLPPTRYSVKHTVEVIRSLLVQLEEMQLKKSLETAEHFRPMLQQMEEYLSQTPNPDTAFLQDHFADRLVAITKAVAMVVKPELAEKTVS